MQTEMIRNKTKYSVPRQAFCDKNANQVQKRLFRERLRVNCNSPLA
jgi:hypothetical protein